MKRRLRRLLFSVHFYAGLVAAPYLLLYGLSALSFNHDIWALRPAARIHSWSRAVTAPPEGPPLEQAKALQRELALAGTVPRRSVVADGEGLRFEIRRPGRIHRVHLERTREAVTVQSTDTGLWGVLRGLHGLARGEGGAWLASWRLYTELSVVALLASVASGVGLAVLGSRREALLWCSAGALAFALLAAAATLG